MVATKAIVGGIIGFLVGSVGGAFGGLIIQAILPPVVGGLFCLLCMIGGTAFGVLRPILEDIEKQKTAARLEEARRRREEIEDEEWRRAKHEELMNRKRELLQLMHNSAMSYLKLPRLVFDAEKYLDTSEIEFSERAFAPFWDAIVSASALLALFDQQIGEIEQNVLTYYSEIQLLPIQMPPFALPALKLPHPWPATKRLKAIVRKAQKDFQFASIYKQMEIIYEQRNTNQILMRGFNTLASAIDNLGDRIVSTLDEMANALGRKLDDIVVELAMHSTARAEYEEQMLAYQSDQSSMLNNLQRGRKPWF